MTWGEDVTRHLLPEIFTNIDQITQEGHLSKIWVPKGPRNPIKIKDSLQEASSDHVELPDT